MADRARLIIAPDPIGSDIMRLLHGIAATRLRFIPDRLLGDILPIALAPTPPMNAPPILLAFNHYPVQLAQAGGAMRVRDALRAFAQPTVLLTVGQCGGATLLAPDLLQLTVPHTSGLQRGRNRITYSDRVWPGGYSHCSACAAE